MALVPHRFLFRVAHPCLYLKAMPRPKGDRLLDLPDECRIENFAAMDDVRDYAEFSLAWNELGLGLRIQVRGKEAGPVGDASRPRSSDGVTLWIDTRDSRTNHRASRYCHQFHFLASGGGEERDEPIALQTNIHRALEDAPLANSADLSRRVQTRAGGYTLEAFLPVAVLQGFDPEQHPRLGFFYAIHDAELGYQLLSVANDFPYWEDPTLWSVLELTK